MGNCYPNESGIFSIPQIRYLRVEPPTLSVKLFTSTYLGSVPAI